LALSSLFLPDRRAAMAAIAEARQRLCDARYGEKHRMRCASRLTRKVEDLVIEAVRHVQDGGTHEDSDGGNYEGSDDDGFNDESYDSWGDDSWGGDSSE
ncbi:hypothetical protein PtrSN001C_008642, partial [Pyrenophora tritici-repentis]